MLFWVMIQFCYFLLFCFQKLSIFHVTNSCMVSMVVDSPILPYILKVYKTRALMVVFVWKVADIAVEALRKSEAVVSGVCLQST